VIASKAGMPGEQGTHVHGVSSNFAGLSMATCSRRPHMGEDAGAPQEEGRATQVFRGLATVPGV
jgi:hypothetical protein